MKKKYKETLKEKLKSINNNISDEYLEHINYNLTNDALFKDYFSNPKNLALFFKVYFNIDINPNKILYLNNETIGHPDMKKPVCDLKFTINGENTIYDIEMQNSGNEAIQKRIKSYFAALSVESIKKGQDYIDADDVILIWVFNTKAPLYSDPSYSVEVRVYSDFESVFNKEVLKDKVVFFDLNKARTCGNIIVEAYSKMLQSVDYIDEYKNSSNTIIKEAALSMEKYLEDNKTLSMALRELLSELDYNTDIKCARLEGEAKGKAELIQELVLKKFQKGYSIEEIAELLELDINQVKQILDKTN